MSNESERIEVLRQDVRDFIANDYPKALLRKIDQRLTLTKEDVIASQRALFERGWGVPTWPVVFGGPGWSLAERLAFEDEIERARIAQAPPMGLLYAGPVIYTFGTEDQRARWLPGIRSGAELWAQGYSEPQAGSDLGALAMSARLDGSRYVVNGTKIWTSLAHWADWIFCLVRTSRETSRTGGISFLCIDMRSPGISVRPIIGLDGSHHLNQVFFDHVEVPVDNRIGEEGTGWSYSRFLLAQERASCAQIGVKRRQLDELKRIVSCIPWAETDPQGAAHLRGEIAKAEVRLTSLEATMHRLISHDSVPSDAPEASMLKLAASELAQEIAAIYVVAAGELAAPHLSRRDHVGWRDAVAQHPSFAAFAVPAYLFERGQTIYGGTAEVQRNIIARSLLGR